MMRDVVEVVVIDDEPGLRLMLEDYLTIHGFKVRTGDGGTALDRLLGEREADLVLLDVNMPGEDGISIAGRLRARGERSGIIMLTAAGDEASRTAGLASGADDYIVKPFELRDLLARVKRVLSGEPQAPVPRAG